MDVGGHNSWALSHVLYTLLPFPLGNSLYLLPGPSLISQLLCTLPQSFKYDFL